MKINENSIKNPSIKKAAEYLGFELAKEGITLNFVEDKELNGLSIVKEGDKIEICYSILAYAFRALSLVYENKEKSEYKILENPDFVSNGFMLDCSRNGVLKVENVKTLIMQMSLMGHSTLMLYTEDTYEIKEEPYFGYMRGRYSEEELKELDAYASEFGIELIPCIQTLAHLPEMLRWNRFTPVWDCTDILLVGEEKTYELIEEMIKACRRSYKSRQINIGMDEAHLLGSGVFKDKNGFKDRFDIMCEHLNRVNEICIKYDFEPMMWSDMFFNIITVSLYDEEFPIEPEMLAKVPKNVKLIFWDYYHRDKKTYDINIKKHKVFDNDIVFAGGAWKWSGFAPNNNHSFLSTKLALDACRGNLDKIFTTSWGDNGNEASMNTILPSLLLFAEYSFDKDLTDEKLQKRFNTIFKCDINDFMLLDDLNNPEGVLDNYNSNPSKYLLYNDPIVGLFDKHSAASFDGYYAKVADELFAAEKRVNEYGYVFKTLASLAKVLEIKANIGNNLKKAYDDNDKTELSRLANEVLPELIARMETFKENFRSQWFKENKAFGFEVIDVRISGTIARLESAKMRVCEYLDGKVEEIPELMVERLYYDCRKEGEFPNLATANAQWFKIVSASDIA
ncbi:MAG: beta-N-acetylhexosaminidase [Clostridia bacterium]